MTFAVILLILLILAMAGASLITQGQTYEYYAAQYSERTAGLIIALRLDDAYHSWWFITISAFLCLNLLLCNVIRLPLLLKKSKNETEEERVLGLAEKTFTEEPDDGGEEKTSAGGFAPERISDPDAFFTALRMPHAREKTLSDGRTVLISSKNRIGYWGAWICHIGILLLILGFGLGQMLQKEYAVYGVTGQSKPVGDTGLVLTIDNFTVGLREDDTVDQYTSEITVRDMRTSGGKSESASISVNNPARLFGIDFSQNSTGWASGISIYKNGELLQDDVICAGEYLSVDEVPELVIFLNAFYPDFVMTDEGGPKTLSGALKNPGWLYSIYYRGEIIGMNVLLQDPEADKAAGWKSEPISINDYEVRFTQPQNYTLIQAKKDHFTWLAFLGGMLVMAGLLCAFYFVPACAFALRQEDGGYLASAMNGKLGVLFKDQFDKAVKAGGKGGDNDTAG